MQDQIQKHTADSSRLEKQRQELAALEADVRRTTDELEQREQALKDRDAESGEAIANAEELELLRAELTALQETQANRQQQLDEQSAHLEQIEQERVAEWQVRCEELNAKQDKQRTSLEQLEQQLTQQDASLQARAEELATAETDLASRREQYAALEQRAEELAKRQADVETREETLKAQESELERITRSLETREIELMESQDRLAAHEAQAAAAAESSLDPAELEELQKQQTNLEQQLAESQSALQETQAKLDEANAAFEAAQQELVSSAGEIASLQAAATAGASRDGELAEEIEHLKMLLEQRNGEVEGLRENLRRIESEATEAAEAGAAISSEQAADLADREADIERRHAELDSRQAELDAFEQRLSELQTNLDKPAETEGVEQELQELRSALEERIAEVAELQGRLEDSPVVSSEARERELDERTRRLDERTEHLTDRELDIKRSEDELNAERERVRAARQELEQRRVALQVERANAPQTTDSEPVNAPSQPEVPAEPAVEQTQHLADLRSELAGMFGMSAPATGTTTGAPGLEGQAPSADPSETAVSESTADPTDVDSPDYVAAYMEQLLARTRGGDVGTSSTIAAPPQKVAESKQVMAPLWSNADEPVGGVVAELSTAAALEAEGEPKRRGIDAKAMRADMQSLREVANFSARSALADYAWKRTRSLLALRAGLIGLSALSTVACYVTHIMQMHSMGWLTLVLCLITVICGIELGYVVLNAKRMKPKASQRSRYANSVNGRGSDKLPRSSRKRTC